MTDSASPDFDNICEKGTDGLWKGPSAPLGTPYYITIHCAATREGEYFTAADIVRWDEERFDQPSYHWVVTLDGVAHRCLTDQQKGAHVALHNSHNIGICYVGGLDAGGKPKDTRTSAQAATIRQLVTWYKSRFPDIKVLGHRDWPHVLKACPCFDVNSAL